MTGLGIRLYTDEDVDARLVQQLRRRGYDVLGCAEAGNASQGRDDAWQLNFATKERRTILIRDFREHCRLAVMETVTPLAGLPQPAALGGTVP